MESGLQGKAVLVTGGATGIGRETALAFAAEGANVAITYNDNREAAEEVAEIAVRMELGEPDSIAPAIAEAIERLGGLDALVVNAVRFPQALAPSVEEIPIGEFQAMIRANVEGAFAVAAAALPSLRAGDWGRIVFVSSGMAEEGFPPTLAAYSTSKAALIGLARSIAWDAGGDGVLVNLVGTGFTRTQSNDQLFGAEHFDNIAPVVPQRRASGPDDVARLILFLGSAANTSVTGELVREGTSNARTSLVPAFTGGILG